MGNLTRAMSMPSSVKEIKKVRKKYTANYFKHFDGVTSWNSSNTSSIIYRKQIAHLTAIGSLFRSFQIHVIRTSLNEYIYIYVCVCIICYYVPDHQQLNYLFPKLFWITSKKTLPRCGVVKGIHRFLSLMLFSAQPKHLFITVTS